MLTLREQESAKDLDVAWRHLQLRHVLPDLVTGRHRRPTLDPARADPVRVDWAQGACWLIRRAMLDEVGLLDERFFLYAEEVDFAYRAALRGWRTYLVPTATVRHAEGSSTSRTTNNAVSQATFRNGASYTSGSAVELTSQPFAMRRKAPNTGLPS